MPLQNTPDDLRRFRAASYQPNRIRPAMDIRRPIPPLPSQPIRPQPVNTPAAPEPVAAAPTAAEQPPSMPLRPQLPSSPQPTPSASNASRRRLPLGRRSGSPVKRRRIFTKMHVIAGILLLILLSGGWFATKALSNVAKIFHGNVFSILTTTKLKGEDVGRVNILVAGNSADDPGHDGANLTDSIMVISIDTKDNTAFLLSIPRDMWVNIPGYGHAKINEAYVDGQTGNFSAPGYANGGMGLLEEVIHQNFGLTTNYYALVNYEALRDAVNAVGGINVNIQSSDPRGLYDPSIDYATHGPLVKLTNGEHELNGEEALDLARARGDAYGSYGFEESDFERTQNQRMIVLSLKNKVLTAGVLANPIAISNLFDSIGKNVTTNFSLSEARRLYDISKGINNNNVQSVSLNSANGKNLLANYAAPNGESALIPAAGLDDFSQIQAFITRLTTNNAVIREDASVEVLNGTQTSGLAAQAQTALTAKGVNVTGSGNATAAATTTIIDASGGKDPATLALLKQRYGSNVTTTNPYANVYTDTFIVVIGADRAPSAATTTTTSQ